MFIYLIVNHVTGKYYVGQHKGKDLKKYFQTKLSDARHNRGGKSYLYASMRKHALPSVWSIHALRSDIQTKEELDQTERDFISFLRSQDPEYGYNICRGGEGFTGPHSTETVKKLSKLRQQMWTDPQFRIKRENSLKEAMSKPEYHINLSEGQQKRWSDPQLRVKKSEEMLQSWADPKARDKKSKALKKAWSDPQVRNNHIIGASTQEALTKFSNAMKQKWAIPETRRRMTEANRKKGINNRLKNSEEQKERWKDPEYRIGLCKTLKKSSSNPKVKARRSVATQKLWSDPVYRVKQSEAHRKKISFASSDD
jgi:hypothetical protein